MEDLFQIFLREWSLRSIQQAFYQLCVNRGADPTDYANVYEKLKQADRFLESSSKQGTLWSLLDKRRAHKEYQGQQRCRGMNVLVIGSGPCGLRAAIECALLGAHVVVAESRDKFTRNNVLHLWQFVIHDLKALGAKVFAPKFCTGSIEHISIRKLQFILLKIALILGVQFYDSVTYEDLIEPRDGKGWRAQFSPRDHVLGDYEFDAVIAASGKNRCLRTFKPVPVRGKLAIGITANFVNRHTKEEDSVPEIQGIAYIYKQDFFDNLHAQMNIKLENIVYYKDDTHYFVMCGDKQNLVQKGVIKKDDDDIKSLLSKDNIDNDMLCKYVMQVVDYATKGRLTGVQFALNARRQPDVAVFDFTELCSSDHSTEFIKYMDHPLILSVVGDLLHEPFWPTGSGCARGFLGVLDTAWFLHGIGKGAKAVSKLLAEREGVYKLLAQTKPDNLSSAFHKYTIDPRERYTCYQPTYADINHLMGTGDKDENELHDLVMTVNRNKNNHAEFQRKASLFRFCYMGAQSQKVRITNFRLVSWADGRALAALISKYNQEFEAAQFNITDAPSSPAMLVMDSLNFAEDKLGVPSPCTSQLEWANLSEKKRIEYLQILVDVLRSDPFHSKLCMSPTLCKEYAEHKATQSAKQAKVLRTRQMPPMDPRDSVLSFDPLSPARVPADANVTVRRNRNPTFGYSSAGKSIRPGLEPLNPELLYKVDRIVAGSAPLASQRPFRPSMLGGLSCKERQRMFSQELKDETRSSRLDDSLQRGSLAGVQAVSQFRAKFDATPVPSARKEKLRKISSSDAEDAHKSHSPVESISSDSACSSEEHPSDPVNDKSESAEATLGHPLDTAENAGTPATNRRSMHYSSAVPAYSRSSAAPYKPPSPPASTAHQSSMSAVYTTISQRRLKLCAICDEEVFLAEQLLVDRVSLHKKCFRCAYCERTLTLGSACVDKTLKEFGPRWYCAQHNSLAAADKLGKLRKQRSCKILRCPAVKGIIVVNCGQNVIVVMPQNKAADAVPTSAPAFPARTFVSADSTDSSSSETNVSKVVVEETETDTHGTQTRPEIQQATQTTPRVEQVSLSRFRRRSPSPPRPAAPKPRPRAVSTTRNAADRRAYEAKINNVELKKVQEPPRTPPRPMAQFGDASNIQHMRRLSDFDSPTKLINACKERTAMRLAAINKRQVESAASRARRNIASGSSEEEDWHSNENYNTPSTARIGNDDEDEEFEDEFVDAPEDEKVFPSASDDEESWLEFVDYLDRSMVLSGASPAVSPTESQTKEIMDEFNKRSLRDHFAASNKLEGSVTPVPTKRTSLVPETPFFTPRESRAETVNTIAPETPANDTTLFVTPMTSFSRRAYGEESVDAFKQRVQHNAGAFDDTTPKSSLQRGVSSHKAPSPDRGETPHRANRYDRRGPRRATVAVDLKREAADPQDITGQFKTDVKPSLAERRISQTPSKNNGTGLMALDGRRKAVHIQVNNENLMRARKEIESVRERRQREKQRQIQALQRRMHEVELRVSEVRVVGRYLEEDLKKKPGKTWELEQWLIYVQQFASLRVEEQKLNLKLKDLKLDEEYQKLKKELHQAQDNEGQSDDDQRPSSRAEKKLMQRLLDVLNDRDTVKAELADLEKRPVCHKMPSQLVKEAPSYNLYEPVFVNDDKVTVPEGNKSFAARVAPPKRIHVL